MKHLVARGFGKRLTFTRGRGFTRVLDWSLQLYITLGRAIGCRSSGGSQKNPGDK